MSGTCPLAFPILNLTGKPSGFIRPRRLWVVSDKKGFVPIGFAEVRFNGRGMLRFHRLANVNRIPFISVGLCCS
jgi:hypothetical protein